MTDCYRLIFCFSKISFSNLIRAQLSISSFCYRIEISQGASLQNQAFNLIARTFLFQPEEFTNEVSLEESILAVKMQSQMPPSHKFGQIRIVQRNYEGHQQTIGAYKFLFSTYLDLQRGQIKQPIHLIHNFTPQIALNYSVMICKVASTLDPTGDKWIDNDQANFCVDKNRESSDIVQQKPINFMYKKSCRHLQFQNDIIVVRKRSWSVEKLRNISKDCFNCLNRKTQDDLLSNDTLITRKVSPLIKLRAKVRCSSEVGKNQLRMQTQSTIDQIYDESLPESQQIIDYRIQNFESTKTRFQIIAPKFNKHNVGYQKRRLLRESNRAQYILAAKKSWKIKGFEAKIIILVVILLLSGLGVSQLLNLARNYTQFW